MKQVNARIKFIIFLERNIICQGIYFLATWSPKTCSFKTLPLSSLIQAIPVSLCVLIIKESSLIEKKVKHNVLTAKQSVHAHSNFKHQMINDNDNIILVFYFKNWLCHHLQTGPHHGFKGNEIQSLPLSLPKNVNKHTL